MSSQSENDMETTAVSNLKKRPVPRETRSTLTAIAPAGLYRLDQFIPGFLGIGRTLWYCGVRHGKFPAPVVKGTRLTLWRGSDILTAADAIATTPVLAEISALMRGGAA